MPQSLIPNPHALVAARRPAFVPPVAKSPADAPAADGPPDAATGVVRRRLANGVRVNYRPTPAEASRGHLRVAVPCGRAAEAGRKAGVLAVAARAMQEGGAMLGWKREQVCVCVWGGGGRVGLPVVGHDNN